MAYDPYHTLNLPHTATKDAIKRSYRALARKSHPDRMANASVAEKEAATQRFARIAEAYALLSDTQRKEQYDHIYKYGGFDGDHEEEKKADVYCSRSHRSDSEPTNHISSSSSSRKRKSTGIGYTWADPFAFISTNGQVQSKMAVCGLQIPSRLNMMHPNSGIRFAFSSGQHSLSPSSGTHKYTSSTTYFSNGKKHTRNETTVVYPDGRKEVVIEEDDGVERRFEERVPVEHLSKASKQEPWYMGAWHGLKDKLAMCYAPCAK
jgi:curved DNA-binding protein CbpA